MVDAIEMNQTCNIIILVYTNKAKATNWILMKPNMLLHVVGDSRHGHID